MGWPSRQELIKSGMWRVATVKTEVGPVRLAEPSAEHANRARRKPPAEGDEVSTMLLEHCVDAEGRPSFASIEEARAALGSLSITAATALGRAFADLLPKGDNPGNSSASPGGALPSGSA